MFTLLPAERAFCRLVAQASLANHFGERRLLMDRAIADELRPVSRHALFHEVADEVRRFVEGLQQRRVGRLACYEGEDRQLLELTFLFDGFHRMMQPFDAHILKQLQSPERPLKVPFAESGLQLLQAYGFSEPDSVRYFGFFFQLRRAFYFIDQELTGSSPCMMALKQSLWNSLFTRQVMFYRDHLLERMEDFSTMLLGETGTGKGAAAAALGRSGYIPFLMEQGCFAVSFASSFLSINLSQFPESLIESELFGHEKGAFTGAIHQHRGVLARCNAYGAIFLDELGEVSVPIQIKLLDVLQNRQFIPVGSHTRQRFSGRILAASNRDLGAMRRRGAFRDDFYYRLCSDEIVLPPLRQRIQEAPAELLELVRHRLRAILGHDDAEKAEELCNAILKQLGSQYPWPGNVRELEQCIRRMLVRGEYEGGGVKVKDEDGWLARVKSGELTAAQLTARYCQHLFQLHGSLAKVGEISGLDWRTVKKYLVQETL
ncbi:MAG: sigma-54-dependent transcriptional regulator [Myxococcota bacterium]